MVYQTLVILGIFILLYGIFSKRIEITVFSGPVIALIVGLVFGPLLLNLFNWKVNGEEYRLIAELALALVLFTDASKANLSVLKKSYALPTRLLLIGLPLTIVFGMICGYLLFNGFSWIEVGILATMLAPVGLQPNSDTKLQKLKCRLLTCNIKMTEYEKTIHS